jgi:tetratricopeptide (TPR) repeat protein
MEAIYATAAPVAGQLARHFLEANRLEKAAHYMLMAAQTEQSRFSWSEAEYWCQSCINLLDQLPYADFLTLRLDVLGLAGRVFFNMSENEKAIGRFLDAIKIVENSANVSDSAVELFVRLSVIYENLGTYDKAAEIVEKGKAILKSRKHQFGAVDVGLAVMDGLLKIRLGRESEAIELIGGAISESAKLEITPFLVNMLAFAHNVIGIAYGFSGMHTRAIPMYKKAGDLAGQIGEKNFQITCLINWADDNILIGRYAEAEEMLGSMLALARQIGDRDNEAYTLHKLGYLHLKLEAYDDAETYLKESLAILEKINVTNFSYTLTDLARVYLAMSRVDSALECSRKAWELAVSLRERMYAQIVMAESENLSGTPERAVEYLKQVIVSLQSEKNYVEMQADACKKLAQIFVGIGDIRQAGELFSQALSYYQELADTQETDFSVEVSEIQKRLAEIA